MWCAPLAVERFKTLPRSTPTCQFDGWLVFWSQKKGCPENHLAEILPDFSLKFVEVGLILPEMSWNKR